LRSLLSIHACGCGILRIRVRRPLRVLGRLVVRHLYAALAAFVFEVKPEFTPRERPEKQHLLGYIKYP